MALLTITKARVVKPIETEDGVAGEAMAIGSYARLNTTTGLWEYGNGSSADEARNGGIVMTKAAAVSDPVHILRKGIIDIGDSITGLTYDDDVFLSDTDGRLADAAGTVSKVVGTVVPGGAHTTQDKLLRVDL